MYRDEYGYEDEETEFSDEDLSDLKMAINDILKEIEA